MTQLSLYAQHVQRWKAGCGSDQCGGKKVVLARGQVPCDVLFVGEAPGPSENVVGQPFIGPAGRLLDEIIRQATADLPTKFRFAFTNVVGCMPAHQESVKKFDEPDDEQVEDCTPRLLEFIGLAKPRLLVMVGKTAADWLTAGYKHSIPHGVPNTLGMMHPAAILRGNEAQKTMSVQRCVINLADKLEALAANPDMADDPIPF